MPITTSSITDAVRDAAQRIDAAGVGDTARLDAELLVGHVGGLDRVRIRTNGDTHLTVDQQLELEALVVRRCTGEPIAYLLGSAWFYGRQFEVDSRVLVPRPETEALVDIALAHLDAWPERGNGAVFVADACTGSGCVGVSIAAEAAARFDEDEVLVACTDISNDALDVARVNAARHAPDTLLLEGDLLRPVAQFGPFAVVVANPPYVVGEWDEGLDPGVRAHEPHVALFAPVCGGVVGLVERLATQALDLLEPGGLVAIEHGEGQRGLLMEVLRRRGFEDVRGVDDLAGIDRVVTGLAPMDDEGSRD